MQRNRLLPRRPLTARVQRQVGAVPHGLPTAATFSGAVAALIVGGVVTTTTIVPLPLGPRPPQSDTAPGRVPTMPLEPAPTSDPTVIEIRTEPTATHEPLIAMTTTVVRIRDAGAGAPGGDAPARAGDEHGTAGPGPARGEGGEEDNGSWSEAEDGRDRDEADTAEDEHRDEDDRRDDGSWMEHDPSESHEPAEDWTGEDPSDPNEGWYEGSPAPTESPDDRGEEEPAEH